MRPRAFRFLDLATFGLAALIITVFAIFVQTTKQRMDAYGLMWATAGCFWAIYGAVVYLRWKFIQSYPIFLTGGILVNPDKYETSDKVLGKEVQRVLALYEPFVPRAAALIADTNVWFTFRPGPFPHPQILNAKVAGFVTVGGESGQIGYTAVDQPIEKTAFAHELGHVILGRAWDDWDEEKHHAFMKKNGLP